MESNQIKLTQIKSNNSKGACNKLQVICKLSKTSIPTAKAVCLNIKNNNTAYISNEYLNHAIFNNLKLSESYKIDLLTLVYYGATLAVGEDNEIKLTINPHKEDMPTYIIALKNGIEIILYDNDAQVKKYFNILKSYKNRIRTIPHINHTRDFFITLEDMNTYPPYAKKLNDFNHHIGYNPATKTTAIKTW